MRYIWDMYSDYYQSANFLVKIFMKLAVNFLQKWDVDSVKNVDYFIANSEFVKKRILDFYKKDATVIYPPVDNIFFKLNQNPRQDYYLFIGRLVPYKRVDLAIEAFKKLTNKKLVIVGDGFLAEKVRKEIIDFPNISYLGFQSEEKLLQLIQQAKACIFAAKEDFGIGCVESQFSGTPVIALRYGGYLETVTEELSGYFFNEQSVDSLTATLHYFEKKPLVNHIEISNSVAKFAQQNFDESISTFIEKKYDEYYSTK
jgi:glycosyltransferase involved in cell wall biosynthesis